ncbi:MAG: hypothetical protein M3Y27_18595 [Acidobacteriota bacterium]|nr:hypothetical protein [Acidobacteriota bacterium]
MSLTPSIVARTWVLLIAMPLIGGRLDAQRMVVPTLPAPPAAKEALYGSVAPDGRSFVYEVVEGDDRFLWKLDLGSLHTERLTPAPGVRYHPVWAADSKRVAYWRHPPIARDAEDSDGLYVLDLNSRTERRVLESTPSEAAYAGELSWLTDGRILYWHMLERPRGGMNFGRFELTAMRPDGKAAAPPPAWMHGGDFDVVSPGGSGEAYSGPCCGAGRRAIWVRGSAGQRCVAGPLVPGGQLGRPVAWSRDEKRLYIVAHHDFTSADTIDHAYAIDIVRSIAWRIDSSDKPVGSVSVSVAGDVALTLLPDRGRIGSLWILPESTVRNPTPGAERLRNCPPIEKPIGDFVSRSNLPKVHDIYPLFEDSSMRLTVFSVTYGDACDLYSRRVGMRFGSRIGWIGTADSCRSMEVLDSMQRVAVWFPLRPGDAYLFSDAFSASLRRAWDAGAFWRAFLLRSPATPFSTIVREVRTDPHNLALAALDNPTVKSDTIPFDARLKLAALEDTLAMSTVWLPSVHSDPERLARVADLPMYRSPGRGVELVHEQMRHLMPTLVKSAKALSERAALHVYMAGAMAVTMDSDSMRLTLLRGLSPPQHRAVFALEAMRDAKLDDAREILRQLGSTSERELLKAIRRVRANELPGSLPVFLLADARHLPWTVLDAMSRLDERFRYVRAEAALALAVHPSTPDSVLGVLAQGLSSHRDPALAWRLLERATADTSRASLQVIAELDTLRYPSQVERAREQLAKLEHRAPTSVGVRRFPLRLEPSAGISDSLPNESWMSADQCLPADDWSEQLRLALGDGAKLIIGHSLCVRAAAALDRTFELSAYDSVYVFHVPGGWALALPPKRAAAEVVIVRFDSSFVERSRQVVRVP